MEAKRIIYIYGSFDYVMVDGKCARDMSIDSGETYFIEFSEVQNSIVRNFWSINDSSLRPKSYGCTHTMFFLGLLES